MGLPPIFGDDNRGVVVGELNIDRDKREVGMEYGLDLAIEELLNSLHVKIDSEDKMKFKVSLKNIIKLCSMESKNEDY